jgi:hypothetical protein
MNFIDRIQPAPRGGGFAMEDYWVWCGSVIKGDDGRYHMFASRWPKELVFFTGYQVASEIVHAVSDTPFGPYRFVDVALQDRGEGFWDGRVTHNPSVVKLGGRYLLFYIGGTYRGPRPTASEIAKGKHPRAEECYASFQIGVAEAASPYGPWERFDAPILSPRPGKWDAAIVTNPAPCLAPDGGILLYYRSNTPEGCRLGVARAKSYGAPFVRLGNGPILEPDGGKAIEDPFVWWNGERYELIAKDLTGDITGKFHAGVHAFSDDGVDWQFAEPPKAYSRTVLWDDGGQSHQGSLERPQLLFENGVPTHLFAATADGPGGFSNATRTWNMVVPLGRQ